MFFFFIDAHFKRFKSAATVMVLSIPLVILKFCTQRINSPHFGICKHHMKPYHIEHQHQETATIQNTA